MLRSVRLKNFVHFRDETIEFEDESHAAFFMGENNSGKSCVFEAIRRCMSTSKSLGMSNPHEPNNVMFVYCRFVNKDKHVHSLVIRPADNQNKKQYDEHVVKIVYVEDKKETGFAVDIMKENRDRQIANKALSETATLELKKTFLDKTKTLDYFVNTLSEIKYISEIEKFAKSDNNALYSETDCESIIKDNVDKTTVITFPMRSISPYQWTESVRLKHSQTQENIKDVSERAEILSWYLNSKSITDIEKERENRYFSIITNNCSYEFQIDQEKNEITALNGNFKDDEKKSISILKVPEGIYEAKKVSIILALDQFKTVCFEDPDRGMHTQMVERLRDLVLHGIEDKVVVVTSHQPSFLSPWTIPHTFHFRRHKQENEQTFKVIALRSISKDEPPGGEKTARIISSKYLPTIFLARRVIFVEGDDDFLFMTALQQILLTNGTAKDCAKKLNTNIDELRSALCPLHIVQMNGETYKFKFRYVCKKLGIQGIFLFDNDALYNNIEKPKGQSYSHEIFPFLFAFEIAKTDDESICERAESDVSALEDRGIFVWKKTEQCTGKIESVVIQFCVQEKLEQFMKTNNVNPFKKWKFDREPSKDSFSSEGEVTSEKKGKKGKKGKVNLFNDPDLSSQNITNAVTKLIETSLISQNTDNEIRRFLKFLIKG